MDSLKFALGFATFAYIADDIEEERQSQRRAEELRDDLAISGLDETDLYFMDSDEWIVAARLYSKSTKVLLETLGRMDIRSVIDLEPLEDAALAFSYGKGWFELHDDIFEAARRRKRTKDPCEMYDTALPVADPLGFVA